MEYPSVIRHERLADGVVHLLSLTTVTISSVSLMISAALHSSVGLLIACAIYSFSVLASFISSASYHLLPHHNWRKFLRRLDHTAIYALIAGTFTPLLVHVHSTWGYIVLAAVWALAIPAMIYKLVGNEIEPWWSLASYLVLGWIAVLALPELHARLPFYALMAMVAGGLIYTFGTFFYAKKMQAYRYAIWHSFVFLGTISFFISIWITVFWT